MKRLVYLPIFSLALSLSNCGSASHEEQHRDSDSTTVEASEALNDTTKFKFDFAIANIPSPANRMHDILALGAPYDNSILHDTKKANTYGSEFKRGINLGIYNMDMAYAMMSDAGQDVLHYLKTIIQLSEDLGMQSAINTMVGKRFESNIDNKDSLFNVWDEILVKSDVYLRDNKRVLTAATVFTGSWLESLYLSCKVGEKLEDESKRMKVRTNLWEQRLHLGNLVKLLNDFKDDQECAALLKELDPIYQDIVSNRQPSELDDADMKRISSSIYSLRDKMTM